MVDASIALVSPWLGPLPDGLPLFLGGVRANPTVRVLIPSDQPAPPDLPPNVTWLPMTLSDFSARASDCLGVPLRVERGFKLCDFRPTYGVVFADEIGDAAFWGYCDQDQVFGNLRAFLTGDALAEADVLTFRGPEWMSGPFAVYRRGATERLYAEAPGWAGTLASAAAHSFDETCGRWDGQPGSVAERVARGERVSITDVVHTAAREGRLRLHIENVLAEPGGTGFSFACGPGGIVETTPGRGGERLGVHFVHAKNYPAFRLGAWDPLPERFWLTPTGTTLRPPEDRAGRRVESAAREAQATPERVRCLAERVRQRIARELSAR